MNRLSIAQAEERLEYYENAAAPTYLRKLTVDFLRQLLDTMRENERLCGIIDKIAEAPGHSRHVIKALEDYPNKDSDNA